MNLDRARLAVRVDVLGPLRLCVDGRPVEVPGVRRRALLALLALDAGRAVSTTRLVDALWPEDPPGNAHQALYNHVSRLRGHLGPHAHRLRRGEAGYRLDLEAEELDAAAARRLASAVTAAGTAASTRAELARAALGLWRGPALAELSAFPSLAAEAVGLDELRLRLLDDLVEARLQMGDRAVAPDAAEAAAASPLRERTALLHVRALALEGRSAEAMAAATAYRRRLAEETGLDPSPALADLEQAVAAGALAPVPDPLARTTAPSRLARPDGPMVGRRHDRDEVLRLVGANAMVTVVGPGGVGKSRLALDVAADPAVMPAATGDVVVVDLAAVDRSARVAQAVASTLGAGSGLLPGAGAAGADLATTLKGALGDRDLLLVLDNCEHVAAACRDLVVALRRTAPGVRVLATSRVTLGVPGEYVVRLQPLPVPREASDVESLRRQPAVRAFVAHARRRRSDFEVGEEDAADLVDVLRRLDGLPLGIELAARQVALMPLREVRDRLDRALDLATGGQGRADGRQRTLRATVDASFRLLAGDDRRLLSALAPFPGGVDLPTVEAVAHDLGVAGDPLDALHRLVDASLLVADAASARYRLLLTVRSFLLDELVAGDARVETERRFLDRALRVAREIAGSMFGPDERRTDQRLRAELDNLRAARDVARAHGRDDVLVAVTVLVNDVATWRDLREVWVWALELADAPALAGHPQRVLVLGRAAEAARLLGDLDRAARLAERALREAGPCPDPAQVHAARGALGAVAHFRGDFTAAREAWLRAAEGPAEHAAGYVGSAALAASYGGDPVSARELLDRAHAVATVSPCGTAASFLAYVEGELRARERVEESLPYYHEAIAVARDVGCSFVAGVASVALASARTRTGDVPGAAEAFAYLLDHWRRTGQETQLWTTARNAAGLLSAVGRPETAALLVLRADVAPGAAAVGPEIARFSGRRFTPAVDLVGEVRLAELRALAERLGPGGVLDRAMAELRELAAAT